VGVGGKSLRGEVKACTWPQRTGTGKSYEGLLCVWRGSLEVRDLIMR
jgi:hypothetical protein